MEVIADGRQTGRTTKLIEMAAAAEARGEVCYIACHSHTEAYRIAQLARKKSLNIGFPITYGELLLGQHGSTIHHIYIDNVELLLHQLITIPIKAVTITTEGGD